LSAVLRNYTHLQLHGSIIYAQERTEFPSNPTRNEQVLINGVLWIYSMVNNVLTWFPLNNKKNTYVHTQGLPSLEWTVSHGLGSQDFVLGVYDNNNNLMSPSSVTTVTEDSFKLNFSEAVIGRVVVFCDAEAFVPAINTESVNAGTINIGNGAVVADATGLTVNGNSVMVLNNQGEADYGTL
jgi:hypothetical protein